MSEDLSGLSKRRLSTTALEDDYYIGVTIKIGNEEKKFFPLALNQKSGSVRVVTGSWIEVSNYKEDFSARENTASDHDECRSKNCPDGYECRKPGLATNGEQDFCYPSLWTIPEGDSKTLLQQMIGLANSGYGEVNSDYYKEDGWKPQRRWCISHKSAWPTATEMEAEQDCAVTYEKTFAGQSVPACAIVFEGSDSIAEAAEFSYQVGVRKFAGYDVWKGSYREYMFMKKHKDFEKHWMSKVRDATKCSQAYITGHSKGASSGVLHRLEHGYGKLVAFASPAIFAPWSKPSSCFGDAFS